MTDYTKNPPKPEYRIASRQYDTSWLPNAISISNGDLTICSGRNANRSELKYRTPILNWAQRIEFEAKCFHVVVHFQRSDTERGTNFDSPCFDIYCPYHPFTFERIARGWLLHATPERLARADAIAVLCAQREWPCCQRFTVHNGVVTSR